MAYSRLTLVLFMLCYTMCLGVENPVVKTEYGHIKGLSETRDDGVIYQFRGIPFAQPPVGSLRFQKPNPINNSWVGKLDATEYGPSCTQSPDVIAAMDTLMGLPNTDISEDCLQLNVYVPRDLKPETPKSVMVWIHGGGWIMCQSFSMDMSPFALRGDVIMVTTNYRLGPFGFLTTGDAAIPGNLGLWDQRLAIKWVKENIAAFGGDPMSITIFGESAGGMSVGLQAISPVNDGLFQRAIAQSGAGSANHHMVPRDNYRPFVLGVAKALGCANEADEPDNFDSFAVADCLRNEAANDILNISLTLFGEYMFQLRAVMSPNVDGEFLPEFPSQLMSDANSNKYKTFAAIDFMAGTSDAEGGVFTMLYKMKEIEYNFNLSLGMPNKLLCEGYTPLIAKYQFQDNKEIEKALCKFYTVAVDGQSVDDANVEQGQRIVEFFSDFTFVAPIVAQIQAHAKVVRSKKNTYQYLFTRRPENKLLESFLIRPDWMKGANHGDDIPFLLKTPGRDDLTLTEEEMRLADHMIDYWANFAKRGNPNGASLPKWPTYDMGERQYMQLDLESSVHRDLYAERMNLWLKDIPEMLSRGNKDVKTEL